MAPTFPAFLCSLLLCAAGVFGQAYDPSKQLSVGIILFPGFQPLDVIGPLDIIMMLSASHNVSLAMIGKEKGPVRGPSPPRRNEPPTAYPVQGPSVVATHTFADAPRLDILLVPGGMGLRVLNENNDTWIPDFIASRFDELQYLLSVCTGAAALAQSGVLKGRRATTNKASWAWATQFGNGVNWVPTARWTEDGNVWTSSGVSAGIDMTYAFFKKLMGVAAANRIMNAIEYTPHVNEHWDPFSVVHKVPGADASRPLGECVGPAGFEFECS
ncbi:class I glutamine amidotransferase-like protein [Immersiella caudata]|uniref:Class I glutamine amidotransferase-like protein n=1 Tax=Immersiella caudata TaxID=314043 RepID=A0AA39WW68_9PEZI|nr:class I glutamine amidotransferase-like protein [Immersiella caudata]